MALAKAKEIVASNPVVVFRSISFPHSIFFSVDSLFITTTLIGLSIIFVFFSKTYCPFCVQIKKLFTNLGVTFKAIELETECAFSFCSFLRFLLLYLGFFILELYNWFWHAGSFSIIIVYLVSYTGLVWINNLFAVY